MRFPENVTVEYASENWMLTSQIPKIIYFAVVFNSVPEFNFDGRIVFTSLLKKAQDK